MFVIHLVYKVFGVSVTFFASAQYLKRTLMDFDQILHMHSSVGLLHINFRQFFTELWPLIKVTISFPLNILRTSHWILTKFCLCIIGWDCNKKISVSLLLSCGP